MRYRRARVLFNFTGRVCQKAVDDEIINIYCCVLCLPVVIDIKLYH